MARWPEIDKTTSGLVRRLQSWWQSKKAGRTLPDRADIDPAEIKSLLPNVLIAELCQPFRIRYRLLGTKVVQVCGFDFTNRYLDELLPQNIEEPWLDHYRAVCDSKAPVFGAVTVPTVFGNLFTYQFGIFPLAKGGSDIAQFIAIEDYGTLESRLVQLINDGKNWRLDADHT